MKKQIIKLLGGLFLLIFYISLIYCALLNLQNLKEIKTQVSENRVTERIIYVEVPKVISENNIDVEQELYSAYMDKLTEDNMEEWWIGYKILTANDHPLGITDVYTEEELAYLYRCVETETYQAPFSAKVNVANVIINRIDNDKFGDTFEEVVTSANQFAYGRTTISEDTKEACAFAFMMGDTTQGALYFHSNGYSEYFNGKKYIFTDKAGHHFY